MSYTLGCNIYIEQQLQNQLDETLSQIENLSAGRAGENVNLSEKQLIELSNFQILVEQTRKQLREVRRNLSKDIDTLANKINILNTFFIPILLIILMILLEIFPVNSQYHEIKHPDFFPFELFASKHF
mgnify:CR=1 FL=1